jgi:hypothetical protein
MMKLTIEATTPIARLSSAGAGPTPANRTAPLKMKTINAPKFVATVVSLVS